MYKEKKLMFLIAETPVHAGSGAETGIVDLPIQRERYTEFPKIESSGIKGCLREAFENSTKEVNLKGDIKTTVNDSRNISLVFGPEGEEAHAGAMTITDARILLFPVKSLKGVFAWITSPMVLERFKKDLELVGINSFNFNNFNGFKNTIPKETNISVSSKVVLEEFTFEVKEEDSTKNIAKWLAENVFPKDDSYKFWKEKLQKDLVILDNDDFVQFVKTSTEVITRTKIDDKTGTVQSGALWTEEYLPQDTIMYSLVMFTAPRVKNEDEKGIFKADSSEKEAKLISEFFALGLPNVIQIGGNQTIGKGFVRLKLYKETKNG